LIDDKKIVDNQEICNYFNSFFVNIGPSLATNIELYPGKDSSSFLGKGVVNYTYLNPIMEKEIMYIVSKFRNKHYCGYDDVNMVIVKKSIQNIIKPLTNICNKSLEKGIFNCKNSAII